MLMAYLTDTFLLDIGISIKFSYVFFIIAIFMGVVSSFTASIWPTMKLSSIKITEAVRT
jgi:ABC-type lipoprotein release transport system permease subunit